MYTRLLSFFHLQERLVAVGLSDDDSISKYGGSVEAFEIADDEHLIGCELN